VSFLAINTMKYDTYHKTPLAELYTLISKKREDLRKLRFDIAGSRGKNTKAIMTLRRDIARLLTQERSKRAQ